MAHMILVVDDDAPLRRAFMRGFKAFGHVSHEAGNGQEALELLRGGLRPSLILCDLDMPVMSGAEFMQVKAKEFPDIPVILCSGNDLVARFAREFSCKAFSKSDRPDKLHALVNQVLAGLP